MLRYVAALRNLSPFLTQYSIPSASVRTLSTTRQGDPAAADLAAARQWLASLAIDTIPRNIGEVSFSRSSGPGGQNVNKVSSKATLRISTQTLFPYLPRLLHDPVLRSRYYAPRSSEIIIQADESRKQADNVNACYRRLHELIVQIGRETVPNETSPEQLKRVEQLQKAEAAGRRRIKEFQSRKKSARRAGRGGDD